MLNGPTFWRLPNIPWKSTCIVEVLEQAAIHFPSTHGSFHQKLSSKDGKNNYFILYLVNLTHCLTLHLAYYKICISIIGTCDTSMGKMKLFSRSKVQIHVFFNHQNSTFWCLKILGHLHSSEIKPVQNWFRHFV